MQLTFPAILAILVAPLAIAAPSAAEPSVTVTVFHDLECATPAFESITITVNGSCVAPTAPFMAFLVPDNAVVASLGDSPGNGCGFIALSDERCATAKTENVIEPALAAGKCIPTLFYGNFAGPVGAEALELVCGPFI